MHPLPDMGKTNSLWLKHGLALQVMDLEVEILDVWEKDGAKCERVRNRFMPEVHGSCNAAVHA